MIRNTLVAAIGLTGLVTAPAIANTTVNSVPAYSCSGGTCHQTFNTGTQTLDWKASSGNLQVLNLNLFNNTSNALTSVSFSIVWNVTIVAGGLTNSSSNTQNFTFKQDSSLSFQTGNAPLATALNGLAIDPSFLKSYSLLSGTSTTLPANTVYGTSTSLTGPLSSFEQAGGGNLTIALSTVTFDSVGSGGGNVTDSVTSNADAIVTVIYTYGSTVPEPFTAALLGSGLVGLGMIRRMRRRA
jgi:hypothetical protein